MKTFTATPADIEKKWILIDAEGVVLGRLASIVAMRLRGKHKPTFTPHMDMGDNVIVINAEGVVLGRLASIVAMRLRGKHKPTFTPHMDMGDNVIVINADKVQLTGDKRNEKVFWHTGYPGGIKHRTNGEILEGKYPERVVIQAVKRMLPGNRLARQQMTHLKVFAGPAHGMEAQKPETLDVRAMNSKNTRTA